ncbi:MAG: M42 family metallopeptidase [Phycisphaerae bacterium]
MRKESFEFLKELLTVPGPSGFEAPAQKVWCEYARQFADEVTTDAYGNAVAVLNPGHGPKILLDAHMDEIALMVKYIDEKGFIYFQRIGGVDPALVRNKRVNIHTDNGTVRGVIGATAIHLQDRSKGEQKKVPKMHEIFIDVGAADGEAAKELVSVGDPITFDDEFEMLNDNIGVARMFDNRGGCWTVIEALRIAKEAGLECSLYACSSIQEETGLNGAQMQAVAVQPDAAIAVDVTHATDTPGISMQQHGEVFLGKGPTVSLGRENHPGLTARVREIAKQKEVDLQLETFSITGGTDAYAYWTKNGGVPSMIVSIPNRYMHSCVEMVDLRDLQATADLLAGLVSDIKKDETFAVKV